MKKYVYLSLIPESLVVSMLEPRDFGNYLATGTSKRAKEEAIYFDVDPTEIPDDFKLETILARCVPHEDGSPKHSVYAAIYRVLERVPLSALRSLWLTTPDGRVLELKKSPVPTSFPGSYHLYQELAPVHPLIASNLDPVEFTNTITDQENPVSVPEICFVNLALAGLRDDAENGDASSLPYKNIAHLRSCLKELRTGCKQTKTVDRIHSRHVPFRCVEGGFYIGDAYTLLHYPFPTAEELDRDHHEWWRSATLG
jgi:hypothetical protein